MFAPIHVKVENCPTYNFIIVSWGKHHLTPTSHHLHIHHLHPHHFTHSPFYTYTILHNASYVYLQETFGSNIIRTFWWKGGFTPWPYFWNTFTNNTFWIWQFFYLTLIPANLGLTLSLLWHYTFTALTSLTVSIARVIQSIVWSLRLLYLVLCFKLIIQYSQSWRGPKWNPDNNPLQFGPL